MPHVSCQAHSGSVFGRDGRKAPHLKRSLILAGALLAVAGCGEAQDTAEDLLGKADTAVDAQGVAKAIRSSVDEQAIEGAIKGAAANAIREELGAVGAVVDEDALVSGIDKAVDGKALTSAIGQAAREAAPMPAPPPSSAE